MGMFGGARPKKAPVASKQRVAYDTDKRGVHTPVNSGKFIPKSGPEPIDGHGPHGE